MPVIQPQEWLTLRWHCTSKYYEAHLHQTLFGDWVVTRVNGSIGQANGQVRHRPVDSYHQGIDALIDITRRRQTRHYQYWPPL